MTARTPQQNKCLHDGLRHLADELNERGLDMKAVLPTIDIPWTMESAKEYLFNRIAKIMFDGRTSSELNTTEMQQVWEAIKEGAQGYLRRQLRTIGLTVLALSVVLFLSVFVIPPSEEAVNKFVCGVS